MKQNVYVGAVGPHLAAGMQCCSPLPALASVGFIVTRAVTAQTLTGKGAGDADLWACC